jgi:hypothetical protein
MSTHFKIDYKDWNEDASPISKDVKVKTSHAKLVANTHTAERNKNAEFRKKVSKGVSKYYGPIEERFLSKIKKVKGGCWEYPNRWIQDGDNVYQPKSFSAEYYQLGFTKEIVWQTCRNKKCVNPKHLIEMSREEQAADTRSKSKKVTGDNHPGSKLLQKDIKNIKKQFAKLLKERNGKPKGIATIIHMDYPYVSLPTIINAIKK